MAILLGVIVGNANAADSDGPKLRGNYMLYGGDLSDRTLPNRRDAKISITIVGTLARAMFDHMGKRSEIEFCAGVEARSRGDVICALGNDRSVECYVGLNLNTGKSINGIIC